MNYKQLTPTDTALVVQLMQVFAEAFEDSDTYLAKPPTQNYTERLLHNPTIIVLAATNEGGSVVGGLIAYELQKFEQARSEIYLYDLAVTKEYRRQGIATGLIDELKVLAKNRQAELIFVQADNEDKPAVALYTKLASSIEREVTHFDIPVQYENSSS
jgi:aminoglycoside 3-N-acetyltransferase I